MWTIEQGAGSEKFGFPLMQCITGNEAFIPVMLQSTVHDSQMLQLNGIITPFMLEVFNGGYS